MSAIWILGQILLIRGWKVCEANQFLRRKSCAQSRCWLFCYSWFWSLLCCLHLFPGIQTPSLLFSTLYTLNLEISTVKLFCVVQVWLEKRYVGSRHTSEWFNTAGRNVKTGLIASVIVSQVTFASCFIFSCVLYGLDIHLVH